MFPSGSDDSTVAIFAVGFGGLIVGLLWLRAINSGEPDPRSFRSSAPRPRDYLPAAALFAAVGLVGLVLLLLATGERLRP